MDFRISARVEKKLFEKHSVSLDEVRECFLNCRGGLFEETRIQHRTDPSTLWFVAQTDRGRCLKVVVVEYPRYFAVKSAFEPRDGSDRLYETSCAK